MILPQIIIHCAATLPGLMAVPQSLTAIVLKYLKTLSTIILQNLAINI